MINLRLKGNSIYWTEGHAEAVFQLWAAVVSGRWEEIVEHACEAMARHRRTGWHWTPPECLAELKTLDKQDDDVTQASTRKQSKRGTSIEHLWDHAQLPCLGLRDMPSTEDQRQEVLGIWSKSTSRFS